MKTRNSTLTKRKKISTRSIILLPLSGFVLLSVILLAVCRRLASEWGLNINKDQFAVLALLLFVYLLLLGLLLLNAVSKANLHIVREHTKANTDKLTGFFNRRAYEDDIAAYPNVPPEPDFVYISMDINELKQVNDSMGHDAGDELIRAAAGCMRRSFGSYGRLYRIGGDEFAGMIFCRKDLLLDLKKDFEMTVLRWQGEKVKELAVSCGYVGKWEFPNATVIGMSKTADQRMYLAKAAYYASKGIDRKGQRIAYDMICRSYTKILRVNLSSDSYRIIRANDDELKFEYGYKKTLSEWLHSFAVSNLLAKEDIDNFIKNTNIDYLRNYFAAGHRTLVLKYGRKTETGDYRTAMLEMIPSEKYTDTDQDLFLFVKQIE